MTEIVDEEHPVGKNSIMSQRQIKLVIYGLMAGMFLSALDQTIVATAIRTIGDDLKGLDQQVWVTTAYLIASTATTPLYGKLSDIFGRRPLFVLSIAIFITGSALSAFATSMPMLAGFRAFQGLGGGGLMALPFAIIADILAPRERAKYQGYFVATFGVAMVVGPMIGGILADTSTILGITGWRWVFLINVPLGLLALLLVLICLRLPHISLRRPRVDWWGASLVVVAIVPLLLVAEQGREWGWLSMPAVVCYAIGLVGLAVFIPVERSMGDDAIIPLRLFASSKFTTVTALTFLLGFGMFGALLSLPQYLQLVLGFTPTQSGLALLPMVITVGIASIGTGQIVARWGRYAVFPILGTAVTCIGFYTLTFVTIDRGYPFLALAMSIAGLGLGLTMQTLIMAVQAAAPVQDIGVATSSATFFRQIGGTLGAAIMLSTLFNVLPGNITTALANQTDLAAALEAAFDPTVATAPENQAVMEEIWDPILDQIKATLGSSLRLVDFSNATHRKALVTIVVPVLAQAIEDGQSAQVGRDKIHDISYLNGADPRLIRPFLVGFNASVVSTYWLGLVGALIAFVITLFFRVPPLRTRSALEEKAELRQNAGEGSKEVT